MPPKAAAKGAPAAADEEPDPTPEELEGKFLLTVLLESASPLWKAHEEAKSAKAVVAVGGYGPKEGPAVEVNESGGFTFGLKKNALFQTGLPGMQDLLNTTVKATLYSAGAADLPVGEVNLDLAPLLLGEKSVGGTVAVEPLPQLVDGALPDGCVEVVMAEGATIKFTATLAEQLIEPEEAVGANFLTFSAVVGPVPNGMVTGIKDMNDPFNVMGTFNWDGQQANFTNPAFREAPAAAPAPEAEGEEAPEPSYELAFAPRRFFLPAESSTKLKHAVRAGCTWDMELARYLKPERAELNDPFFDEHHAMGKLTGLYSLMEPGQKSATISCKLLQFPKVTPTEDDPEALSQSMLPDPQPSAGKATVPDNITDAGLCMWEVNEATVTIDLTLSAALVAAFEAPPVPKFTLNELLPKKPPPAKVPTKEAAKQAYREEVKAAVALIADEYIALFGATKPLGGDTEVRRKRLIFELNRNGQYYNLKEKLKTVVRNVAKEQHVKTPGMTDRQLQELYNDLYVTLLDEMHAVLRALQSGQDAYAEPARPPVGEARLANYSLVKLKKLADEYETNDDFANAKRYHEQCLLLAPKELDVWHQYALYCLRAGELGRAEEALRECLVLDRAHTPSMLALAVQHLALAEYERAEVYARAAQVEMKRRAEETGETEEPLPWYILGLLYEETGDENSLLKCEWESKRLSSITGQNLAQETALMLLGMNLGATAEKALKSEPKTIDTNLCLARASISQEQPARALEFLDMGLTQSPGDPRVLELMGHTHYTTKAYAQAEAAYQETIARASEVEGGDPVALQVYLRLGQTYFKLGKDDEARQLYMSALELYPCRSTWEGLGVAYFRLHMMSQAEECFKEANLSDYLNANVWGWLCITCLEREQEPLAEQALDQAYKCGIADASLLGEIGGKYFSMGRYEKALDPLRAAVQHGGGLAARCLLAETQTAQGHTLAAKATYQAALGTCEASDDKIAMLERLIKVTLLRGEEEEAKALAMQISAIEAEVEAALHQAAADKEAAAAEDAAKFDMSTEDQPAEEEEPPAEDTPPGDN